MMYPIDMSNLDSAGSLCPECQTHLDTSLEDPLWVVSGLALAMKARRSLSETIARYLIVFHMLGHPSDEEAARLAEEEGRANKERAAAPCN